MRKLIAAETLSANGYFCGPNGEIDWMTLNDEFNAYSIELLDSVDALLFGRITYEMMVSYWPTMKGEGYDREIAKRMNGHQKIGVSSEPLDLTWNNSQQIEGDLVDAVTKIKQLPGGDIAIFGSGSIVTQLTDAGLIDEYRLLVTPLALGDGKTLLAGVKKPVSLELVALRQFATGFVLHTYAPAK